jgi:hypothetical protein
MTVVQPPSDDELERGRIRRSNTRDQEAEKRGKPAPHNRGYDAAADGPDVEPQAPETDEEDRRLAEKQADDPSGHGMQTTPGQQRLIRRIEKTAKRPPGTR